MEINLGMDSEALEFKSIVAERASELSLEQVTRLGAFYSLVRTENELQNLTRLISPTEFFEGHVEDVLALKNSGLYSGATLDLGTGLGSPGLIYALLFGGDWVLCDSERSKAQFISRAIEELAVIHTVSSFERAETLLNTHKFESICAKAVGPVGRIYNWIKNSSTWNNLILFKGPGWEQEWSEFQSTGQRNQLTITKTFRYEVGSQKKTRVIVQIDRK